MSQARDMTIKDKKFIVFAVDHFSPLGVIRSLGEVGISPVVILYAPDGSILIKYSKYISELHQVKSIEEGFQVLISEYADNAGKNFLFATSDEIVSYLDLRYEEIKAYFYCYHAGEMGRIARMMRKSEIVRLAQQAGLNTPKTEEVNHGELPATLQYPILTKAPTSTIYNWKSNVFICRNEKELKEAYTHIKCEKVLLQEYIEKVDELNIEGFCLNDGKDVYMPLQNRFFRTTSTSYGNYLYIERFKYTELLDKIHRLFELTHFNGIFEMEFMIDRNGELYFLEINFRNSAWLYAYTRCGLNFPLMFAKSIVAGKIIDEDASIQKLPFVLMDEITDFKWSVLGRKVSFFKWLKELRTADCVFYYNKQDRRPFYMYLLNRIKRTLVCI